ncbi:MAG: GAF domain-containing protein [Syntrophobacteraceae bacterium]|nr:GAF domain-containing protein [Desulfobacteraceae bacterium]
MDILERIEKVSKTIELLSEEVRELKGMASQALPSGPQPVSKGGPGAEDALGILVNYLALSPGMEEDSLLNTLLNCAMMVVRAEGAAVTLYDAEKNLLVFRAAVGVAADKLLGVEVPIANSQHGLAFRMRQVHSSTPMYKTVDSITGVNYRSVLAAPLVIDDQAIGTLGAVNKLGEDHFTVQDIEDYANFAELAAHIIQQRLRETSLKQMIHGDAVRIPKELSALGILKSDRDLLEITQNVAAIGRRSPELLSLCRQFVEVLAGMA